MIYFVVGTTYANRDASLGITKESGFGNVLRRLKEIRSDFDNSGMCYCSFGTLMWLFSQVKVVFGTRENCVYIPDEKEFCNFVRKDIRIKTDTVYSAWLKTLYDLNEDIDEMFRYGAIDTNDDVIFLKNLLVFLSYTLLYEDKYRFMTEHGIKEE